VTTKLAYTGGAGASGPEEIKGGKIEGVPYFEGRVWRVDHPYSQGKECKMEKERV